MEPCQIFLYRYQNIDIYVTLQCSLFLQTLTPVTLSSLTVRSAHHLLQRQLFLVQKSGLLLVRLRLDIFIGY